MKKNKKVIKNIKKKLKNKSFIKKLAISLAVSASVAVTIFHFDIDIATTLVEMAGSINIDVTTNIHIH